MKVSIFRQVWGASMVRLSTGERMKPRGPKVSTARRTASRTAAALPRSTVTASTPPVWLELSDNGDGTTLLSELPTETDVGDNLVILVASDQGDLPYISLVPSCYLCHRMSMIFQGWMDTSRLGGWFLAKRGQIHFVSYH